MMKSLIIEADEDLVAAASKRAGAEHTSLPELVRQWLEEYAKPGSETDSLKETLNDLRTRIRTGGNTWSREELYER